MSFDQAIRDFLSRYPWAGYLAVATVLGWALWAATATLRLRWRNRQTRRRFEDRQRRLWQGHHRGPDTRRVNRKRK